MLANILVAPGLIEVRDVPVPEPSSGELLVKIKTALTCGTDLKAFRRGHPVIPMPGVFGHEFSGIVAKAGKGVRRFREGDEIMAVHTAPCLECRFCAKRLYNLCENIMNTKVLGAFAEYILLPAHIVNQNVFLKPEKISFEEAAFLEPLSCVVHCVQSVKVKKNDHALVIGAGPIGLLHLLLLKEKGADVTIMDKHRNKLRLARELGADVTVISNPMTRHSAGQGDVNSMSFPQSRKLSGVGNLSLTPSFPLNIRGMKGGYRTSRNYNRFLFRKIKDFLGFDHVFECTGIPEVWEDSVNYVRRGGTVILFGGCKSGTKVTYDAGRLHYDEIALKGTFHFTPLDVKKAYTLLTEGKLGVSRLVSGSYRLSQTRRAFDKLSKGIGIKYAITP